MNCLKKNNMKRLFIFAVTLFTQVTALAQEGTQIGASVSTGVQFNTHRSKTTTLWSSQTGYGFAAGVPVKHWLSETRSLNTGLEYEYTVFDNRVNNYLVSSIRYHSIHIPLRFDMNLVPGWYLSFGPGLNYFVRSRMFTPGNTISLANSANPFQPYLSLGINTFSARGSGFFELGLQMRYHFLDLWKKTYPDYAVTSSKLLSLDLVMRFYF